MNADQQHDAERELAVVAQEIAEDAASMLNVTFTRGSSSG